MADDPPLRARLADALRSTGRDWWIKFAWRLGFYLLAGVVLLALARHGEYVLVLLAAIGFGLAGIWLHHHLTRPVGHGGTFVKLIVWTLLIEAGAVVCLTQHLHVFGFVGFLGLSLAVFGVGQLSAELRANASLLMSVIVLAAANLAAALVVSLGFGIGGWPLLGAGILLGYPTIGLASERLLNRMDRWGPDPAGAGGRVRLERNRLVVGAAGIGVAVIGALLFLPVGGLRFSLILLVVIGAVVYMIASNTDADVLVVLFVLAVVWTQVPRGNEAPPAYDPARAHSILVLGDSYISGEGARHYLQDTNVSDPARRNECRRSARSWAMLVARDTQLNVDFLACSGAKGVNLVDHGQYIGENPPGFVEADHPAACATADTAERPERACILSQVEQYDAVLAARRQASPGAPEADWVFVSIGGNDAGFGDLVKQCLAPGDCSANGQAWLDGLASKLRPVLDMTYDALAARFPDKVVLVPYPIPISASGCGFFDSTFTDAEHRFLNGFTAAMDQTIAVAAAAHGLRFLSEIPPLFQGSRICDTDAASAAVNYLALNPVNGDIDPRNWIHNSMHPKDQGHRLIADAVEQWLGAPSPPSAPASVAAPTTCLATILEDPSMGCTDQPTRADPVRPVTPTSVRWRILSSLVVVIGAWMFALSMLSRRRLSRRTDAPHWTFAGWLDQTSARSRLVAALALVLAALASLWVIAWTVGLGGGYGSAQYSSASSLRGHPEKWWLYKQQSWRDLYLYVPAYALIGIGLWDTVRRRRSSRAWKRLAAATLGVIVLASVTDIVETALFRKRLGDLTRAMLLRLPSPDIGTVTTVTQVFSGIKGTAAVISPVLLLTMMVRPPTRAGDAAADGGHPVRRP